MKALKAVYNFLVGDMIILVGMAGVDLGDHQRWRETYMSLLPIFHS